MFNEIDNVFFLIFRQQKGKYELNKIIERVKIIIVYNDTECKRMDEKNIIEKYTPTVATRQKKIIIKSVSYKTFKDNSVEF